MATRQRTPPSETKTYLSPAKNATAAAAALREISDRFNARGGLEVTLGDFGFYDKCFFFFFEHEVFV